MTDAEKEMSRETNRVKVTKDKYGIPPRKPSPPKKVKENSPGCIATVSGGLGIGSPKPKIVKQFEKNKGHKIATVEDGDACAGEGGIGVSGQGIAYGPGTTNSTGKKKNGKKKNIRKKNE